LRYLAKKGLRGRGVKGLRLRVRKKQKGGKSAKREEEAEWGQLIKEGGNSSLSV